MSIGFAGTLAIACLLTAGCGDDGGGPVTPTPVVVTYPDVGGRWEGAIHATRVSATGAWEEAGLSCEGIAECEDDFGSTLLETDFVQDAASITGTVRFLDDDLEWTIESGTISTDGALSLAFHDLIQEDSSSELTIVSRLKWDARVNTDGVMMGDVEVRGFSDAVTGELIVEGCLGPASRAECAGWRR